MVAVDTNVVVRLLTNDDPRQARRAARVFAANDVFVAKTVLLETEWVLRHAYQLERADIARGLLGVLGMHNVVAEDPMQVSLAIDWFSQGLDFADALHLAASQGAEGFLTFDQKLVKRASAIAPIEVVEI